MFYFPLPVFLPPSIYSHGCWLNSMSHSSSSLVHHALGKFWAARLSVNQWLPTQTVSSYLFHNKASTEKPVQKLMWAFSTTSSVSSFLLTSFSAYVTILVWKLVTVSILFTMQIHRQTYRITFANLTSPLYPIWGIITNNYTVMK